LAGECRPSEEIRIRSHLAVCPGCARELEELKALDGLLDTLKPAQEPPDLLRQIMAGVEKAAGEAPALGEVIPGPGRPRPGSVRSTFPRTFRDLAAAVAVSLAISWLGGGWLGNLASYAGSGLTGAVTDYMRYTGLAMNRAQSSISAMNGEWQFKADRFKLPNNFRQGSDQQ